MMESVGFEKGLIRFVSENGIKNGTKFEWTRRVKSYTILLILLLAVLTTLLLTRSDFQTTIFRQRGTTYQTNNSGYISNIFEINLTNKTRNNYNIQLKLEDKAGKIELVVHNLKLKKEAHLKDRFIVKYPFKSMINGKKIINIIVLGNGKKIQKVKVKFIGPMM